VLLMYINEYPIINPNAHTRPFSNKRLNMAIGIFLPLGILVFLRIWRYRLRLRIDLRNIENINTLIINRIIKNGYGQQQ
jgi:lipopolysaccharide export system permease protein